MEHTPAQYTCDSAITLQEQNANMIRYAFQNLTLLSSKYRFYYTL